MRFWQVNLMMMMVMMILNNMHEAKQIDSCMRPKADNSHISRPLPKWSHDKVPWLCCTTGLWWQLPPRLPRITSHSLDGNALLATGSSSVVKLSDFLLKFPNFPGWFHLRKNASLLLKPKTVSVGLLSSHTSSPGAELRRKEMPGFRQSDF